MLFAIFASVILLGGYILGRYDQWRKDDEIPILFLCKELDQTEEGEHVYIKGEVILVRGEWTEINKPDVYFGTIQINVPVDEKYAMSFPNVEVSDNDILMVNTIRKSKIGNQEYVFEQFKNAKEIRQKN